MSDKESLLTVWSDFMHFVNINANAQGMIEAEKVKEAISKYIYLAVYDSENLPKNSKSRLTN